MAWSLCTSGAAVSKAGVHCNAISGSAVTMANWSSEAEGFIQAQTHTLMIGQMTGALIEISGSVSDIVSSRIAMNIISYDTTGYLTREADTLMNLHSDIVNKGIAVLKDRTNLKLISP